MRKLVSIVLLSIPFLAASCDDEGDTTTTSTSETQGSTDSMSSDSATSSMMSEEVCMSDHMCLNDVCECSTPGLEGMSCTDDEACEDECEVCMES